MLPKDGGIVVSPSSRRAWIEIMLSCFLASSVRVALLAEGVDRNFKLFELVPDEIVALLAEGVDRNFCPRAAPSVLTGRPPRGGRG